MTPDTFRLTQTRRGVRVLRVSTGWWRVESPGAHGVPTIHRVYSPAGILEHVARTYAGAVIYLARAVNVTIDNTAADTLEFELPELPELPKGTN